MNKMNSGKLILAILILNFVLCGCGSSTAKEDAPTEADVTVNTVKPAEVPVITMEDTSKEDEMTGDIPEDPEQDAAKDRKEESRDADDDNTEGFDDIEYDVSQYFQVEEISDELFGRMKGKSFPDNCTTAREDLRYLRLLYKDLDGVPHEGEMVCNAAIADSLCDIFRKLYEADYPIEKIRLIDEYDGNDDASMSDNNTSCFNYRVVSGTTKISKHGYGLAVDLNPFYNPYIHTVDGETVIEPEGSEAYADRDADYDYKIDKDDLAYKLFTEAGFTWGGSWKTMKDYQHFQMD